MTKLLFSHKLPLWYSTIAALHFSSADLSPVSNKSYCKTTNMEHCVQSPGVSSAIKHTEASWQDGATTMSYMMPNAKLPTREDKYSTPPHTVWTTDKGICEEFYPVILTMGCLAMWVRCVLKPLVCRCCPKYRLMCTNNKFRMVSMFTQTELTWVHIVLTPIVR